MRALKIALLVLVFMEIPLVVVNSPAHPLSKIVIEMENLHVDYALVVALIRQEKAGLARELILDDRTLAQRHEPIPGEGNGTPAETEKFLIENGPKLIAGGDYKQVLDLVKDLPGEVRNKVEIRTLEYVANLKGWVLKRDEVCKTNWWTLRTELIKLGDSEATQTLVIFLRDRDPYLRLYSAELLSHIGDKRALNDLREVGEKDENSQVRKNARWAYEQISGKKF